MLVLLMDQCGSDTARGPEALNPARETDGLDAAREMAPLRLKGDRPVIMKEILICALMQPYCLPSGKDWW